MAGNKIINVGSSTSGGDAVTRAQLDIVAATIRGGDFLASGNIALTGNLKMGGNKVTGLAAGVASNDAVTKAQLDAVAGTGTILQIASKNCTAASRIVASSAFVSLGAEFSYSVTVRGAGSHFIVKLKWNGGIERGEQCGFVFRTSLNGAIAQDRSPNPPSGQVNVFSTGRYDRNSGIANTIHSEFSYRFDDITPVVGDVIDFQFCAVALGANAISIQSNHNFDNSLSPPADRAISYIEIIEVAA